MYSSKDLATKEAKAKGYTHFQYNGEDYFVDFNNRDSVEKAAKHSGLKFLMKSVFMKNMVIWHCMILIIIK